MNEVGTHCSRAGNARPRRDCGASDDDGDSADDNGDVTRPGPTSRSAWPTTSAAVATSRSTTRPQPASTRPSRSSASSQGGRGPGRRGRVGSRGAAAQLVDAGYNPIIAVGFAYSASVGKVAPEYPDVNFAIVDETRSRATNIANLVFAEEQGSFLVGAAAALKTEAGHIGFVGGVETPLIQKFEAGYDRRRQGRQPGHQGRRHLPRPSRRTSPASVTRPRARRPPQGMYDDGADIVYHAAGGSGGGVFEAAPRPARATGRSVSTPTSPRRPTRRSQDGILTSMLKNVDVAVYDFLKAVDGRRRSRRAPTRYDLEVDGVGYSTSGGFVDDISGRAGRVQAADHRRRDQGPDRAVIEPAQTRSSTRARVARGAARGPVRVSPAPLG